MINELYIKRFYKDKFVGFIQSTNDSFGSLEKSKKIEWLLSLDVFYNIEIGDNKNIEYKDLKEDDNFKIEVFNQDRTEKIFETEIKYFQKYNNINHYINDLYYYGNKLNIKDLLLNNIDDYCNLDYSFKPKHYNFFGIGKIYYGVELEIACNSVKNYDLLFSNLIKKDLLKDNKTILKDDNSIRGNNATEIVTAPHTRIELNKIINDICKIFDNFESGARGHNVGGMHIHCSLASIKEKTIINLLRFFFNRENAQKIIKIAQRNDTQYADLYDINKVINQQDLLEIMADINSKKPFKKIKNNDRYSALNFTENTLEFRIFNSNLKFERLMKNIDMVESILKFCSLNIFETDYMSFENFIFKSRKYKYLKDYIKFLNEE